MSSNLEKAADILKNGNYTLVAVNGNDVITSTKRGIKPLLQLLDNNVSLNGFSAADKVIGKAAAFLYVLLEINEVYSKVISKPALAILEKNNIRVQYDFLTDAVRNRDNTGFCPMETAVMNTDSAESALLMIYQKLDEIERVQIKM